ncbi:tRNA 2'-phosphotransferase [Sporothrix curviconia]|uniref:2'-phosphotransferase n=1 Tax=Sporothrix curviconia TaxID=1260050 RepID=A0ABP0B2T1_9PEZI
MDDFDNAESLAAQFHDRLSSIGRDGGNTGRGGGKSGGGRRGGRRGGGGGGGGSGNRNVDVSRALSKLLRHQAANAGIPLDPEGYAPLNLVLQWGPIRSLRVTLAEVRDIVITNDKQRFAMKKEGGDGAATTPLDLTTISPDDDPASFRIRANQGHSIAAVTSDAGLLTPIDDPATAPPLVCHGTFLAFWRAIEASGGLRRMTRNHVHCGCLETDEGGLVDREGRPIPGLRRDAQVLVFLDVRRALREDPALKWWRAANGVVLTEGNADGVVPTRFFRRVVLSAEGEKLLAKTAAAPAGGPTKDTLVLWEDGKKLADVPAETLVKARVPMGKQGLARRAADVAAVTTAGAAAPGPKKRDRAKGPSRVAKGVAKEAAHAAEEEAEEEEA